MDKYDKRRGNLIREFRNFCGMNQTQFGVIAGEKGKPKHRTTICNYEAGMPVPREAITRLLEEARNRGFTLTYEDLC